MKVESGHPLARPLGKGLPGDKVAPTGTQGERSTCDSQLKAAASAREANVAEIETKRLLAHVGAQGATDTRRVADTKSVGAGSEQ